MLDTVAQRPASATPVSSSQSQAHTSPQPSPQQSQSSPTASANDQATVQAAQVHTSKPQNKQSSRRNVPNNSANKGGKFAFALHSSTLPQASLPFSSHKFTVGLIALARSLIERLFALVLPSDLFVNNLIASFCSAAVFFTHYFTPHSTNKQARPVFFSPSFL